MQHTKTSTIDSMVPSPNLSSRTDQVRYALGTAAVGLAIGGLFVLTTDLDSIWLSMLINAAFLGAVLGAQRWIEQTSGATPLHAKRRSNIGFVGSVAAALFLVLPMLNSSARSQETSAPLLALAIAAVALPTLIGAALIARPER